MKLTTSREEAPPPNVGGEANFYAAETMTRARLWRVELSVRALLWWPVWEGYAFSSQQATARATSWFTDTYGPLAVDVIAVMEQTEF